ncbi:MAG: hypothetical protein ACYC0M_10370 [Burkholderiales bacterium]
MKEILLDAESGYEEQLLNLLADDIRLRVKQSTARGSYAALDLAVDEMKMGAPMECPDSLMIGAPEEIRTPDPLVRSQSCKTVVCLFNSISCESKFVSLICV